VLVEADDEPVLDGDCDVLRVILDALDVGSVDPPPMTPTGVPVLRMPEEVGVIPEPELGLPDGPPARHL